MNRSPLLVLALAAASLAACSTPFKGDAVTFDASALGGNINAQTGATIGQLQASMHFTPVVAPDGKTPVTVPGPCGTAQAIATYSILAGNASASVSTTPTTTVAAGATPAPAQALAVAANQMASTGEAAIELAGGGGGAPLAAEVEARFNCSQALPAAAGH